MARSIIRLAGGTYERLKALSGLDALQEREVVISKDTHELYVGKKNGNFELLTNVHIGQTLNDISSYEPQKGRFFFDEESGSLYLATGIGWKRAASSTGVTVSRGGALEIDQTTGELKIKVDNKTIVIDNGELTTGSQDLGEF